jgi:hypothetical protein
MSVESSPLLSAPADSSERVWRYMDFAKFVSLISREELYFCNLEVLAKSDPHEGLLSQPNYRHRQWHTISDLTPEEHKAIFFTEMSGEQERIQFESHRNSREYWLRRRFYDRRTLLVNCWHVNRYESAAMWTQYVTGGQGIAITSSYTRIVDALAAAPQRVFLGMVKYLDWDNEPVDNSFAFPFSKRMSFNYEKELRIVYWDLVVQEKANVLCQRLTAHMMDHLYRRISTPINWDLIEDEINTVTYMLGIYIPVDINFLIDEIYVAPTSPDWFLEVIQTVCEKFSLRRIPRRSDLLSSPMR